MAFSCNGSYEQSVCYAPLMWVESIEMKQVNILVTIFLLAKVLFPAQTCMKLLISVREYNMGLSQNVDL